MKNCLVIVESPSKIKCVSKCLGNDKNYTVLATAGVVKEIGTRKKLGIDIKDGYTPTYNIIKSKMKYINKIKNAYKTADEVYLCGDNDAAKQFELKIGGTILRLGRREVWKSRQKELTVEKMKNVLGEKCAGKIHTKIRMVNLRTRAWEKKKTHRNIYEKV